MVNEDKSVIISMAKLRDLYETHFLFDILTSLGVDNWEGYDEALTQFDDEYSDEEFENFVDENGMVV